MTQVKKKESLFLFFFIVLLLQLAETRYIRIRDKK